MRREGNIIIDKPWQWAAGLVFAKPMRLLFVIYWIGLSAILSSHEQSRSNIFAEGAYGIAAFQVMVWIASSIAVQLESLKVAVGYSAAGVNTPMDSSILAHNGIISSAIKSLGKLVRFGDWVSAVIIVACAIGRVYNGIQAQ